LEKASRKEQELKRAWRGKSEREEGVCCQYGAVVRSLARTRSTSISMQGKQQLVSCVVQLTGVTICSLLAAILLCAEFRHIWWIKFVHVFLSYHCLEIINDPLVCI
jgi:hypothetical protein